MANVENGALQTAIDNAATGDTIILTSDIALTSKVTISKEVAIDLNGYVITGDIDDSYGLIYVSTQGILTITDSSSEQTGCIVNNISNVIGNYGTVNIYGGMFKGNYALYNFYYNDSIYGKSNIYGGVFKSIDGGIVAIANCGNLNVSGGTIEYIDTSNICTITDGNIETLYIGTSDYTSANQNTTINGGNISILSVADDSANEIVISGGTFSSAIADEYLADGFKLAYNTATEKYSIVVDQSFKVVATSSSRVDELDIKNGQLIFIQDSAKIAFDFKDKRVIYDHTDELNSKIASLEEQNTDLITQVETLEETVTQLEGVAFVELE